MVFDKEMDDFAFGTDIWATGGTARMPTQKQKGPLLGQASSSFVSPPLTDTAFDDGDAFDDDDFHTGTLAQPTLAAFDEDGFGDFGEFGEIVDDVAGSTALGSLGQSIGFEDADNFASAPASDDWTALRLVPMPSSAALRKGIGDLLGPLWEDMLPSQFLIGDDIRQVGGINQVLVTTESRTLYTYLFQSSQPNTQRANWTRSRIRRQHLVSLGIPVNLDELLPQSVSKPLPTLEISTRPLSAPPGSRTLNRVTSPSTSSSRPNSRAASRSGTPKLNPLSKASTFAQLALGPQPEVDDEAINEMLALSADKLTLLPLKKLEAHLRQIQSLTESSSKLLAYLLQQRDALQQDSETYNQLIAELVAEAQKMKSGPKARTGGARRTSGL